MTDPLRFADQTDWRQWLESHHADTSEAWLQIRKTHASLKLITINQALEGALAYGWIDGLRRRLDADSFLQRYSPRTRRSPWSLVNRAHAEALIEEGRMAPAGLALVAAARADGRWDSAYPPQSTATVPDDLARALESSPRAADRFASLTRGRRYLAMLPVLKARPHRRQGEIAKVIATLKDNAE